MYLAKNWLNIYDALSGQTFCGSFKPHDDSCQKALAANMERTLSPFVTFSNCQHDWPALVGQMTGDSVLPYIGIQLNSTSVY